jgi:hypothetical protein
MAKVEQDRIHKENQRIRKGTQEQGKTPGQCVEYVEIFDEIKGSKSSSS